MPKSLFRLYAPFLALALVQALFIAVAPSRGPDTQEVGAFGVPPLSADDDGFDDGLAGDDDGPDDGDGGPTGPGQQAAPGQNSTSNGGNTVTTEGGGTGPDDTVAVAGDTSHCTPDGRQHGVVFHAPSCKPKWTGGDNGGATYTGVTADTIKVIRFRLQSNEQVDTILRTQGLASSQEEEDEFQAAAEDFLNAHHEFYGRKLEIETYQAKCPTSPQNPAVCREDIRTVIAKQPFAVIWGTPLYPELFDEFARAGILILGGWHFEKSYFADRRPYRWDVFMDGDTSAEVIADYWCKKMQGKPATHSGRVIHPTIGNRGEVRRKLGIITQDFPGVLSTAQYLQRLVTGGMCGAGDETVLVTSSGDITTAQTQGTNITQQMIQKKVTTTVCMCNLIAPVFETQVETQQNYYPEHLLPGLGLIDYDLVGRLYEPSQWVHAFGPSHLYNFPPFEQTDAAKVWKAAGRSGVPYAASNLPWGYLQLVGAMIQEAGPILNPLNVERAMMNAPARGSWEDTGGRADVVLVDFGQADYTALSDAREAYWRPDKVSVIDGRPGAYESPNGGRRYPIGGFLPGAPDVPPAAQ